VIVLVHAGICDARMWDGFELPGAVRHELRGFGSTPMPAGGSFSHAEDLAAALGDEPAALVGASFGGLVCLEVAARWPERVRDLVLLDAGLPDHDWSEEVLEAWKREDGLLEAGELQAAAEWCAEFWVVDPSLRERVAAMQQRAYELEAESEAEPKMPESIDLAAISARTLVVVGERDNRDMHAIAERLAREIPDARHTVIEGASHLPALERQTETLRMVREFLNRI
jgi:3-oxoadipate enol-lactonase